MCKHMQTNTNMYIFPYFPGAVVGHWSFLLDAIKQLGCLTAATAAIGRIRQQHEKRRNALSPLCSQAVVSLSSCHFLLIPRFLP